MILLKEITEKKKLRDAHTRAWLGELAPFCLGEVKDPEHSWREMKVEHSFRRGWLDSLKVENYSVALTRALARSPAARLLRRLHLEDEKYEEPGEYEAGDDVFNIGLNRAVTLIADKAQKGRSRFAPDPGRPIGEHPDLGGAIVRGKIDLLAETSFGPLLVDYKTDALGGADPAEVAGRYETQRDL